MHDSNAKRLEEQQLSYQARFPLLYISLDNQIDRRSCKRITEMKVLALGMSRTGTVGMFVFLALPFGPCWLVLLKCNHKKDHFP